LTEGIFAKFAVEKIQKKIDTENLPKTDPFDTGNLFRRIRSSLAGKKKADEETVAARKASGIRIRGCELLKRAMSVPN
jgi:hypothetical protein